MEAGQFCDFPQIPTFHRTVSPYNDAVVFDEQHDLVEGVYGRFPFFLGYFQLFETIPV
jgi:hypothetical protein